jgi:uncharacterized protein
MTTRLQLSVTAGFFLLANLEVWFLAQGMLGPFLVGLTGLLALILIDGRQGLVDFGRRFVRWKVGSAWYAIAILLPFAVVGVANLFSLPWVGKMYAFDYNLPFFQKNFWPLLIYAIISIYMGEEVAWRGFLLPQLQKSLNGLNASLVLGIIWTFIHLPSYLMGGPQSGLPFWVFTVDTIALTVLMTWIFNHTGGSILLATLYHVFDDLAIATITPALTGAPTVIWTFRAVIMVVLAVACVAVYGVGLKGRVKTRTALT